MKRLIIILVFKMLAGGMYAQTLSIGNYSGTVGNTVLVSIDVDGLSSIGAMTLFLSYDTSVLSFDTVLNIFAGTPDLIANETETPSRLGIAWSASSSGVNFNQSKLCDLRFIYHGGASTISFTNDCEVVNFLANPVSVIYDAGSISPAFTVSVDSLDANYCINHADEVLYGTPAGGTFLVDQQPAANLQFASLGVGQHSVSYTYTNAYGVAGSAQFAVMVHGIPVVSPATVLPNCFGMQTGSIQLSVSGGTPPFSYLWSNGSTLQNISGLPAGNYAYTVTSAFCTASGAVPVSQPAELITTITPTHSSAFGTPDGSLSATISGGTAPYTLIWSTGATGNPITQLSEGHYSVTVSDQHGCSLSNSIYLRAFANQSVEIPAQWSIFSLNIEPVQKNISQVLSELGSNVQIAKDENGMVYWPQYSVNAIGNTIIGEGYQIKLNTIDTLNVNGYYLHPEDYPITLPLNWSIFGYLRLTPISMITLLNPVVANVSLVKSGNGSVYWPQFNLNMIGNAVPGQGYQIKMLQQQNFTFPPN